MKNMVMMISLFLIIALATLASGSSARQEPLLVEGSLTAVSSEEGTVPAEAAGLPVADSEPCGMLEDKEAVPEEEGAATGISESDRAGEVNSDADGRGVDTAAGGEGGADPGSSGGAADATAGEGSSPDAGAAADEPE